MHAPTTVDLATAVATCVGAVATLGLFIVACFALRSWRYQMRVRPAAEMLSYVYSFRTRLYHARRWDPVWNDFVVAKPGETEESFYHRRRILWPIEILFRSKEALVFNTEFAKRRYMFQAIFGSKADKPLQDLQNLETEILEAAFNLNKIYRDVPKIPPTEQPKWELTIGLANSTGKDPISQRLEEAIAKIERVCRPFLRAPWPMQ